MRAPPQGLALLPELVELDAARNRIARVTGLERCASLAELNLAGNRVSVLAGVPASLQTLRLDRNGLRAFRNWDTLRVVELSLAGNALAVYVCASARGAVREVVTSVAGRAACRRRLRRCSPRSRSSM